MKCPLGLQEMIDRDGECWLKGGCRYWSKSLQKCSYAEREKYNQQRIHDQKVTVKRV